MAQSRSTEVELQLLGLQMIVDQPSVMTVDRDRGTRAARIEREHHPGGPVRRHQLLEPGRLDVGRLYTLDDRRSRQARADRLAHKRAAAVASDRKRRGDTERVSTFQIAAECNHLLVILLDGNDFRSRQDRDPWLRSRVAEQKRLEIGLVDPVRRLWRWPPRIRAAGCRVARRAAGNFDTAEFDARRRGSISAIVGEVRRQSGVTQRSGHAKPAEYLHRTRRDVIALDAGWIARTTDFGDHDIYSARRQIHCRGKSDGARAHNQHLRPHSFPSSCMI